MKLAIPCMLMDDRARAHVPEQRDGDSGSDLHATHDVEVLPGGVASVDFGVAVEIPVGYGGFIFPRSGLASTGRVAMVGVIDSSYRGSIGATLLNTTRETWHVKMGDRVAQLVVMPVPRVKYEPGRELGETERGTSGFGSTGHGRDVQGWARKAGNGG